MKKKLGIVLFICLILFAIIICFCVSILKFGLIVRGDFSLQDADNLFFSALRINGITSVTLFTSGFLALLLSGKNSMNFIWSFTMAVAVFCLSFLFTIHERNQFLDNGRENAIDILVENIQEIRIKDLKSGGIEIIDKARRGNIWKTEYLINRQVIQKPNFELEVIYKNGMLKLYMESKPDF